MHGFSDTLWLCSAHGRRSHAETHLQSLSCCWWGGTRLAAPFADNIFSENVRVEKRSKNKKCPPRDSANSGNSIKRFLGFAGVARFWDNIENWFFHQNHRENAKTLFLGLPQITPSRQVQNFWGGGGEIVGQCCTATFKCQKMPKTEMYHYSPSRSQKCEFCEFWDLLAAFREN